MDIRPYMTTGPEDNRPVEDWPHNLRLINGTLIKTYRSTQGTNIPASHHMGGLPYLELTNILLTFRVL